MSFSEGVGEVRDYRTNGAAIGRGEIVGIFFEKHRYEIYSPEFWKLDESNSHRAALASAARWRSEADFSQAAGSLHYRRTGGIAHDRRPKRPQIIIGQFLWPPQTAEARQLDQRPSQASHYNTEY